MSLRFQCSIFLLSLIAAVSTSDSIDANENGFSATNGAFYSDDAVILNVPAERVKRETNTTRDGKQLLLLSPRQADEGAFGVDCQTNVGKKGTCKSFRDCYPLFKVVDLSGYDGWVMGHYDTCSYINNDNTEVFGVCCTQPVGTPPQQEPDVQRFGVLHPSFPLSPLSSFPGLPPSALAAQFAYNNQLTRQIPAVWPPTLPPLPTHPPDHTAPTHPPSLVAGVTHPPQAPASTPPTTTWGTKPPSTTKQTWPPAYPTQPVRPTAPTQPPRPTAPVGVDTSCGVKNGPQVYGATAESSTDEERIVGGHNAELNEWPWIVALFNGGRQFCGGSLIDNSHVLSAAHCVAQYGSFYKTYALNCAVQYFGYQR